MKKENNTFWKSMSFDNTKRPKEVDDDFGFEEYENNTKRYGRHYKEMSNRRPFGRDKTKKNKLKFCRFNKKQNL
jgi:hypothetical protein